MSMHNGQYYLSNSEMSDWESGMCPQVWKAKHIDKTIDFEPSEAMLYGSWFETLAIGSGVGGKITEPTVTMAKSAYADRVKAQAADCRRYLKVMGGKVLSRQEYIYTTIRDAEDQVIPICGGLDILYGFPGIDRPNIIIDLKFTGDNDSDFGPYQYGNPEKINPAQAIHYRILHKAKYGSDCEFQFWIFDKSPSVKQKRIGAGISEVTEAIHIDKVSRVYNEIMMALELDDFGYKNSFDNCRSCPCKCPYERILPDLVEVMF
jgi:hypothetical protein